MPIAHPLRPRVLAAATLAMLAAGVVACASTLEGLGEFPCGTEDKRCPDGWICGPDLKCHNTAIDSSDAGPPKRECEYHTDCDQGAKPGACIALWNGGSMCTLKCSGITNGCPGEDCKLVLSGVANSYNLVPACMAAGSAVENATCANVNMCSYGLTCAAEKYNSESYVCTEICNPFKSSCTNSNKHCTYGMSGYPADWGLCYPQ